MICNEPSRLGQTFDYVVAGAKKLKENNTHFALDFMMADRKSTRLNSSHIATSRMPSSA